MGLCAQDYFSPITDLPLLGPEGEEALDALVTTMAGRLGERMGLQPVCRSRVRQARGSFITAAKDRQRNGALRGGNWAAAWIRGCLVHHQGPRAL